MVITKMIYKNRLIELREEKEIKQYELAKIINIYKGAYNQYETEYVIMPIKHLNTICNYFNVSLDYIFNFTNIKQYPHTKKDINLIESGKRLKELRKKLNYTQAKFADILKVARTIISKYEKGEYVIATHTLYTICKNYNISTDYLLGKIDNPENIN